MIDIINPNFKMKDGHNLFKVREEDYKRLIPHIYKIFEPVVEEGFQISELQLKDSYAQEMDRNLYQLLNIILQKGDDKIDLSLKIPKIVDGNFVIIGGKRKIPLFQLFDLPFVTTADGLLKIRTNIATFTISKTKNSPYVLIKVLGSDIPLSLLILSLHTDTEEVIEMFDLNNITVPDDEDDKFDHSSLSIYDALRYDLKNYLEDYGGKTKSFYANMVNGFYTKSPYAKGENILYALDIVTKVDPISAKFFNTKHIIDEAVDFIKKVSSGEFIDDTNLLNKRLRCMEYMVLRILSKAAFDLCMLSRGSMVKLKINSKQIISEVSVSDVVQFDTSINPIENLTSILRCTYLGKSTGGFDRSSIPIRLRDINPTMFGRICPVETPDRENCGVVQSLIPNANVDVNYKFTEEVCEKQPISLAVSMVPFLEKDDQTRLQMASSQMRQAINLKNLEQPFVRSGSEGLFSDYTYFVRKAKNDGEVVFLDSNIMIVLYCDQLYDILDVGVRNTYTENIDIPKIYVSVGDKVKKGDILLESNYCENGKIQIGKNLLTVIMPYYGYNYEDSIVISDKLVNDNILTSVHHVNLGFILSPDKVLLSLEKDRYKPLPDPMSAELTDADGLFYNKKNIEYIKKGNPYAIIKELQDDPQMFTNNFIEPSTLLAKKDVMITSVELYPNTYNRSVPEFSHWVEKKFQTQLDQQNKIHDIIKEFIPKDQAQRYIKDKCLDKFSLAGNFKIKDDRIRGMYISIKGIYYKKIKTGDKIGNRHGNKGVICKIVPHEKMPQLPDGRHAEIIINPLGTISRMNIGQIFELHLAMSLNDLKNKLHDMLQKRATQRDMKKYILDYIKILDNTETKWYTNQAEYILSGYRTHIDKEFIDKLYVLAPPFESSSYEQLQVACKYTDTPLEYKIYDPSIEKYIINPEGVGYMYFFRMVHIAEDKISSRGIGSYSKKTLQPPGGRKNHGGQRCGEMETFCFAAHDGIENLSEILTTKSDCMGKKNKFLKTALASEYIKDITDDDMVPESVKLMEAYLKIVGIDL